MAGIFKAYDIRGIVGEALNPEIAHLIGRGLAECVFKGAGPIALTHDMRSHSLVLYSELGRGLREGGCDTLEIGLAPTPMNYWAINEFEAAGGVQVTASHNGPEYNGFKVSGAKGTPLDHATGLDLVEKFVAETLETGDPEPEEKIGSNRVIDRSRGDYIAWMNSFMKVGSRELKIGIDAGNGMGGFFLPSFFKHWPQFEVDALYFELDGSFPNHEADPLKAENLLDVQKLVEDKNLDLGVAFDGDADRCMFVDENGQSISADLITALIAGEMLKANPGPILYDLRSSQAVPQWIEEHGGTPVRGRVGHSFMKRLLKAQNARFGGELSGHYYFADCFNTDSGLMALIQILNLLSNTDQTISQLIQPLRRYAATGEINYRVADAAETRAKIEAHYGAQGASLDHLDGLTVEIGDIKTGGWWFNLRSSNTEPLLRLNLEAPTSAERDARLAEVQDLLGAKPVQGH